MKKINNNAFSLIEVLVWMFLFFMGMISVYSVINSTIKLNDYNKDYIIAANLAREQTELVRNIRDTNNLKIQAYNQLEPQKDYRDENIFKTGSYYKIENNFTDTTINFNIKVEKATDFKEDRDKILENTDYRLCLTPENLYVFCSWKTDEKKTEFYKYIKIEEVPNMKSAFKVTSKVIWYKRWYHEFDLKTMFTDYKIF